MQKNSVFQKNATAIATGGWYTVEIDITSSIDGATIKAKDVSLRYSTSRERNTILTT